MPAETEQSRFNQGVQDTPENEPAEKKFPEVSPYTKSARNNRKYDMTETTGMIRTDQ